jgi:hypothetical protein
VKVIKETSCMNRIATDLIYYEKQYFKLKVEKTKLLHFLTLQAIYERKIIKIEHESLLGLK